MSRRYLLGCIGSGFTIVSVGCLGLSGDSEPEASRLSNVMVRNIGDDEGHEVEVTVEDDGDTVFSETWQIEPGSKRGDIEIAPERGRYVVRVVFEETEQEINVTDETDDEDSCVNLRFDIWIDDDGDPRIASTTQPPYDDC